MSLLRPGVIEQHKLPFTFFPLFLHRTVEDYDDTDGFDGMAILRAIGNFLGVFLGAFALGSVMGCVTALLTKYTHIRDYPLLETSLFFLMSYGTFLAAEAAQMTGQHKRRGFKICEKHEGMVEGVK